MKTRVFFSEADWAVAAADEVLIDAPKQFSLVLSGGSTPAPVYRELATREWKWKAVDIYLADERFVPPFHAEANAKLIRENVQVPARFHWWDTDLESPQEAAAMYDTLLKKRKKPFDVVILGVGPDGHIASLFPHSSALNEKDKAALATETEHFAIRERLTMTPPMLLGAKKIIVLLKGTSKLPILKELESGAKPVEEFPAALLRDHPDCTVLFANV